ncbi:MAG: hypothetical protein UU24_C0005G0039 [Candidatus Nomurabacteria bacterium GW2011_GWA2_40_9]|uniref:Uncharacterized protein n=1 Tax=Candidatus Nomurabacteria bacterium GW2011_GWA2_40_9 TaxID=1618734 RepID=A0A0G0TXS7_9BACT|nr:MAG: hypothetical protein UU24_C0005G0039 [Candidatus Nomurabacteria bacterium GW2011_GWA2_40_9]
MKTIEFIFFTWVFFGMIVAIIFIFVKYKKPKKIPEANMENFRFVKFKDLFPDE